MQKPDRKEIEVTVKKTTRKGAQHDDRNQIVTQTTYPQIRLHGHPCSCGVIKRRSSKQETFKEEEEAVMPGSKLVIPHDTPDIHELYTLTSGKNLGEGQFGTTYLCTEKSSGVNYACKSIDKVKLICREDYEDVWREIQIMHHLSEHPEVVEIRGAYEDDKCVYIVMELCGGGELFDRIIKKGHYSEKAAARIFKVVVKMVQACHSLGVMHRDLKPENFLFLSKDDDSVLKATDFGLSIFYRPGSIHSSIITSSFSLLLRPSKK